MTMEPAATTSDDIIRQALESSGLATQDKPPPHAYLHHDQDMGGGDEEEEEEDDGGGGGVEVAAVSHTEQEEVAGYMLPQHVMKEGELSTMHVHDAATGKMKKHMIRKVSAESLKDCIMSDIVDKRTQRPKDVLESVIICCSVTLSSHNHA
jgi:hypothetical protein